MDMRSAGVTADPDVDLLGMNQEDEFIILASDGLWDKLTPDKAVAMVRDTVKEP